MLLLLLVVVMVVVAAVTTAITTAITTATAVVTVSSLAVTAEVLLGRVLLEPLVLLTDVD